MTGWVFVDGTAVAEPAHTRPMGHDGRVVRTESPGEAREAAPSSQHRTPPLIRAEHDGHTNVPVRLSETTIPLDNLAAYITWATRCGEVLQRVVEVGLREGRELDVLANVGRDR